MAKKCRPSTVLRMTPCIYTFNPFCNRFANVRRYAVETFIVLNSPVAGSNTRFFWMFAFQFLRVLRSEWLRVLPKLVRLPVLTQVRGMEVGRITMECGLVNMIIERRITKSEEARNQDANKIQYINF